MIETLTLGLNFVTSAEPGKDPIPDSVKEWGRKIDCAIHFADPRNSENGTVPTPKKRGWLGNYVKTDWSPPPQTWRKSIPNVVEELAGTKKTPDQVRSTPESILQAIKKMSREHTVHILKADKGGNVVIWHKTDYDREALRQLEDKETYFEMTLEEYITELVKLKERCVRIADELLLRNHITKNEHKAICDRAIEGARIYFLPKTHKAFHSGSNTFAGRPIVATHSGIIHLLDKYLTELTAFLLPLIPGSLRDTTDMINKLPTNCPFPQTRVTTADVEGLYPSIPWEGGIHACVLFYRENLPYLRKLADDKKLLEPPSVRLFADLLTLVVSNSYFSFKNKRYFRQMLGTAMGMCISVFFANCFMYDITKRTIQNQSPHVHCFLRYIDDILIISDETFDANAFFAEITTEHIRYTIESPSDKQSFLDTYVAVVKDRVITSPYRKPTASGLFLNPTSNHPSHVFSGIPKAQFMRLRRISSLTKDFKTHAKLMRKQLRESGYDRTQIYDGYYQALNMSVHTTRKKQNRFTNSMKLIAPYNQASLTQVSNDSVRSVHNRIVAHYDRPSSAHIAEKLDKSTSSLVHSVLPPLASAFSKQIKKP